MSGIGCMGRVPKTGLLDSWGESPKQAGIAHIQSIYTRHVSCNKWFIGIVGRPHLQVKRGGPGGTQRIPFSNKNRFKRNHRLQQGPSFRHQPVQYHQRFVDCQTIYTVLYIILRRQQRNPTRNTTYTNLYQRCVGCQNMYNTYACIKICTCICVLHVGCHMCFYIS